MQHLNWILLYNPRIYKERERKFMRSKRVIDSKISTKTTKQTI